MTSTSTHIRKATDQDQSIATLLRAFNDDPMARWAYPESYSTHFSRFMRLFGGAAFEHGTAYCSGDYAGVALWLPPGVQPQGEAIAALFQETLDERQQETIFDVLEQMDGHRPAEDHWYLPLIGVEPALQGRGHGSALLEYMLVECDRSREPAYLESTNVANLPLYERHGFERIGEIQIGNAPPLWPMLRRPRR
jgi:ribosomal protein S18 acetylase RimI-like enzyme